jgi:hypothetical protein
MANYFHGLSFALLLFSFSNLSCWANEWLEEVPEVYQGNWVETSDNITAGIERPDSFVIRGKTISRTAVEEGGFGDNVQRFTLPIQKVCRVDPWLGREYIIIFYGAPNKDQIADHKLKVVLEPRAHFCLISSVFSPYGPDSMEEVFEGRFVQKAR